ncbi:hypothetical protein Scep_002429 [Stephania cephalantha]|uniref:Uncharacterized protein n=1 Tax=Stephania cephalantha TaxID=152367 RepID=A0AAP0LB69_9MAGN
MSDYGLEHGLGDLAGKHDVSRCEWWRGCCKHGLVRRCSVQTVQTTCGVFALVGEGVGVKGCRTSGRHVAVWKRMRKSLDSCENMGADYKFHNEIRQLSMRHSSKSMLGPTVDTIIEIFLEDHDMIEISVAQGVTRLQILLPFTCDGLDILVFDRVQIRSRVRASR